MLKMKRLTNPQKLSKEEFYDGLFAVSGLDYSSNNYLILDKKIIDNELKFKVVYNKTKKTVYYKFNADEFTQAVNGCLHNDDFSRIVITGSYRLEDEEETNIKCTVFSIALNFVQGIECEDTIDFQYKTVQIVPHLRVIEGGE